MRRPHLITPRRSLDRRNASVPSTRSCSVLFFFFSKRMIFSRVVELILAHQQLTGRRRRRLSRTSFLLRLLLIAVRWSGRCSSDMTRTRARTSTESGEAAKEIKTVFFSSVPSSSSSSLPISMLYGWGGCNRGFFFTGYSEFAGEGARRKISI